MVSEVSKTKILLVDDLDANLLGLRSLLESDDVECLLAKSGEQALNILLEHHVALALVDVQMPGMSGFDTARHMRMIDRTRAVPIIFVTASQFQREHIFEGYDQGAVDYLIKPFDVHIVRSKVRAFVELDQKRQALAGKSKALALKLKEVERLKDLANAANEAKSRFLANMSHEIRTPLGAVLGYADLLASNQLDDDEWQSGVQAISRNGQVLQKIIDDVLDLAKIEAGKIDVEILSVNMDELIFDLRTVSADKARAKGIAFELVVAPGLPADFRSDPVRLRQILNNIIGNALKFTDAGTVTVSIKHNPKNNLLSFAVADTGCGLSPAEAKRLFQPFVQADTSTTRRFGGTGLGLVISRQLAHLLGGDVQLQRSELGVGSTFTLEIAAPPVVVQLANASTGSKAKKKAAEKPLDGYRILVVDDAQDNRLLIGKLLETSGATVLTAASGPDALKTAATAKIDLVLMDLQMPGMDGYEAAERLRAAGFASPIIALTADVARDEKSRQGSAAFARQLSKPVSSKELVRHIKAAVESQPLRSQR